MFVTLFALDVIYKVERIWLEVGIRRFVGSSSEVGKLEGGRRDERAAYYMAGRRRGFSGKDRFL